MEYPCFMVVDPYDGVVMAAHTHAPRWLGGSGTNIAPGFFPAIGAIAGACAVRGVAVAPLAALFGRTVAGEQAMGIRKLCTGDYDRAGAVGLDDLTGRLQCTVCL
jgi:hypothetical protein